MSKYADYKIVRTADGEIFKSGIEGIKHKGTRGVETALRYKGDIYWVDEADEAAFAREHKGVTYAIDVTGYETLEGSFAARRKKTGQEKKSVAADAQEAIWDAANRGEIPVMYMYVPEREKPEFGGAGDDYKTDLADQQVRINTEVGKDIEALKRERDRLSGDLLRKEMVDGEIYQSPSGAVVSSNPAAEEARKKLGEVNAKIRAAAENAITSGSKYSNEQIDMLERYGLMSSDEARKMRNNNYYFGSHKKFKPEELMEAFKRDVAAKAQPIIDATRAEVEKKYAIDEDAMADMFKTAAGEQREYAEELSGQLGRGTMDKAEADRLFNERVKTVVQGRIKERDAEARAEMNALLDERLAGQLEGYDEVFRRSVAEMDGTTERQAFRDLPREEQHKIILARKRAVVTKMAEIDNRANRYTAEVDALAEKVRSGEIPESEFAARRADIAVGLKMYNHENDYVLRKELEQELSRLERGRINTLAWSDGDAGFFRAMGDELGSDRNWLGTVIEPVVSGTYKQIGDKMEQYGWDALSGDEQETITNLFDKQLTEGRLASTESAAERYGVIAGQAVPFMVEFAAMSAAGGMVPGNLVKAGANALAKRVAGRELTRLISKQSGRAFFRGLGSAFKQSFGRMVGAGAVKAFGVLTGDLVNAAIMTNTVQLGKTLADADMRQLGGVRPTAGGMEFRDGMSRSRALYQAEMNSVIEDWSEMFGTSVLDAGLKRAVGAKAVNRALARIAERIGWSRGSEALLNQETAPVWMEAVDRIHRMSATSGAAGEIAEEYAGQLARTMVELPDAFTTDAEGRKINLLQSKQFHTDTCLGMISSMGVTNPVMALVGMGGAAIRSAYKLKVTDARAGEAFGTIWAEIKSALDNSTNRELAAVLNNVIYNSRISEEQTAAVLNYTEALTENRAGNIMAMFGRMEPRNAEEKAWREVVMEMNARMTIGAEAESMQEVSQLKAVCDYQAEKLAEETGMTVERVRELYNGDWLRENMGTAIPENVRAYLNAEAALRGYKTVTEQKILAEQYYFITGAMRSVNPATGTVVNATVHTDDGTDARVRVIQGRVVLNREGNIDRDESDKTVIADINGQKKQVSIGDLDDVESVEPKEFIDSGKAEIADRWNREAERRLNGEASPGDEFDFGEEHIRVVSVTPEGLLVERNGEQAMMAADELGAMLQQGRIEDVISGEEEEDGEEEEIRPLRPREQQEQMENAAIKTEENSKLLEDDNVDAGREAETEDEQERFLDDRDKAWVKGVIAREGVESGKMRAMMLTERALGELREEGYGEVVDAVERERTSATPEEATPEGVVKTENPTEGVTTNNPLMEEATPEVGVATNDTLTDDVKPMGETPSTGAQEIPADTEETQMTEPGDASTPDESPADTETETDATTDIEVMPNTTEETADNNDITTDNTDITTDNTEETPEEVVDDNSKQLLEDENSLRVNPARVEGIISVISSRNPAARANMPTPTIGEQRAMTERNKPFVERALAIARQLNYDHITVFGDYKELLAYDDTHENTGLGAERNRSLYERCAIPMQINNRTGEVFIFAPAIVNSKAATVGIMHEVVAHKGIAELFGGRESREYRRFMESVFRGAYHDGRVDNIMSRIINIYTEDALTRRQPNGKRVVEELFGGERPDFTRADTWGRFIANPTVRAVFADEYCAAVAEMEARKRELNTGYGEALAPANRGIFERIRAAVNRLLYNIGIKNELGVNDIVDVLCRAERKITTLDTAEATAHMLSETAGEEMLPAEEENVHMRSDDPMAERYERRMRSSRFQMQEALQDSMLSLRRLMEDVTGRDVWEVEDSENAYVGENRCSSKTRAEIDRFRNNEMAELNKAIARLGTKEEVARYMQLKHAVERSRVKNAQAAERYQAEQENRRQEAAERYMADFKPDNEEDMEAWRQEARRAFDQYMEEHPEAGPELREEYQPHDRGGLTALTGEKDYEAQLAAAEAEIADYEAKHKTDELWAKTRAITEKTLEWQLAGGLISDELYERLLEQFDYYIPLKGRAEKHESDYSYVNRPKSEPQSVAVDIALSGAHTSLSREPFADIQQAYESAVAAANRNMLVKQPFLNFVRNHPGSLFAVTRPVLHCTDGVWTEMEPPVKFNAEALEQWQLEMEQLCGEHPEEYREYDGTMAAPSVVDISEHQVRVLENGRPLIITVMGNPRVAQAVEGLTNPGSEDGIYGTLVSAVGDVNRFLASMYTTNNPNFVASNYVRDMIFSNTMVHVREGQEYAFRFNRNYATVCNLANMRRLYGLYESGKLGTTGTERLFGEFMREGGETGFIQQMGLEWYEKTIEEELKRAGESNVARDVVKRLAREYMTINAIAENAARFAAYKTSREAGREVGRSIWDAKQISVNFNKKGSGARFAFKDGQTGLGSAAATVSALGRGLYVFWNAGMQGSYNFFSMAKHHPAKFAEMGVGVFMAGVMQAFMHGDDDDYWQTPEFLRRSSVMVKGDDGKGEKRWWTISLPIEYRMLFGMGELAYSAISGHYRANDGAELAETIAGEVSQVLPLDIMEGGGATAMIPSSVKPAAEAMMNKSWTGGPIYSEYDGNENNPEWTKAFGNLRNKDRMESAFVDVSKWINAHTGGNDYKKGWADVKLNNPAVIVHLLSGYLSGPYQFMMQLANLGAAKVNDTPLLWRDVPIASRFIRDHNDTARSQSIRSQYRHNREKTDETSRLFDAYARDPRDDYQNMAEDMALTPDFENALVAEENGKSLRELGAYSNENKLEGLTDETEEDIHRYDITNEQIDSAKLEVQQATNDYIEANRRAYRLVEDELEPLLEEISVLRGRLSALLRAYDTTQGEEHKRVVEEYKEAKRELDIKLREQEELWQRAQEEVAGGRSDNPFEAWEKKIGDYKRKHKWSGYR